MKASQFCYWLQGYFELTKTQCHLEYDQVDCIKKHLALVFKHELDKEHGSEQHQDELNDIHNGPTGPASPPTWRC